MTDINELAQRIKAAAERATPGRWVVTEQDCRWNIDDENGGAVAITQQRAPIRDDYRQVERTANAEYIATVNPENILALVEALEKAQRANAAQDDHINQQQVVPPEIEPDYEVIKSILPTANPDEYACCIAADMWNACRAAMLQAGNSPEIPDSYVLVPREPTKEILDEFDSIIDYGAEDSDDAWRRLLAAAPQSPGSEPATVPGKWIPVSERLPDDEQEVIAQTHSGWRYVAFYDEHSGLFYDSPEGGVEYVLVTHWMPLPAAPKQENI